MTKGKLQIKLPEYMGSTLSGNNVSAGGTTGVKNVAHAMFKIIVNNKRAKVEDFDEDLFNRYIVTLMAMNQHDEFAPNFIGVPTEMWMIPNLFTNMVFPCAASVVSESGYPSLIDTHVQYVWDDVMKNENLRALTFEDFNMVTSMMYSMLRVSQLESTSMKALRARKSFSDVAGKLVENGKVHWTVDVETPFYFAVGGVQFWNQKALVTDIADYIISRFQVKWHTLLRDGSFKLTGQSSPDNTGNK